MPFINELDLQNLITSLLGRTNIRPRSITEDKLAPGAASAAVVRDGSISDIHIGTLEFDTLTGSDITSETITLAGTSIIQSSTYSPGLDGWIINADGTAEFNDVTMRGVVTAGEIHIPDTTTAESFHVDTAGQMWVGATAYGGAPFRVSAAGDVVANNATITGVLTAAAGSDIAAPYLTSGTTAANLVISSYIQSSDWNPGLDGWAIDASGTSQLNDVTIRGVLSVNSITDWLSFTTGGGMRTNATGARMQFTNTEARHFDAIPSETHLTRGGISWDVVTGNDQMFLTPAVLDIGSARTLETELWMRGADNTNAGQAALQSDEVFLESQNSIKFNYGVGKFMRYEFQNDGQLNIRRSGSGEALRFERTDTTGDGNYMDFYDDTGRLGWMGYFSTHLYVNQEKAGKELRLFSGGHILAYPADGYSVYISSTTGGKIVMRQETVTTLPTHYIQFDTYADNEHGRIGFGGGDLYMLTCYPAGGSAYYGWYINQTTGDLRPRVAWREDVGTSTYPVGTMFASLNDTTVNGEPMNRNSATGRVQYDGSSIRFKSNVRPWDVSGGHLEAISKFGPKRYTKTIKVPLKHTLPENQVPEGRDPMEEVEESGEMVGLVAEHIEAALGPDAIVYGADGEVRNFSDRCVLASIVGALGEVKTRLEALEGQ